MPDRPILFSAPMVRALLAGTKTQTRRVIKLPKWAAEPPEFEVDDIGVSVICEKTGCFAALPRVPQIGDRLWVKETWRTWRIYDEFAPTKLPALSPVFHEADRDNCDRHGKARVSIHMPRWASRLTLTVTDVRVERLQDISEADAIAEGVFRTRSPNAAGDGWEWDDPRDGYRNLWDNINGPGAWAANPWVVAVSFDVRQGNIDA